MKFRAVVELNGKTATGIEVPVDVMAGLGPGKRHAVLVTLGEYTYRTTVGSMGGRFLVPVSAEVRARSGVAAGDSVDVVIELDGGAREVVVPSDFAGAMEGAGVRSVFDGMSYTHRKEHVRAIEEAKKPETRQRRIEKAIEMLSTPRR